MEHGGSCHTVQLNLQSYTCHTCHTFHTFHTFHTCHTCHTCHTGQAQEGGGSFSTTGPHLRGGIGAVMTVQTAAQSPFPDGGFGAPLPRMNDSPMAL